MELLLELIGVVLLILIFMLVVGIIKVPRRFTDRYGSDDPVLLPRVEKARRMSRELQDRNPQGPDQHNGG